MRVLGLDLGVKTGWALADLGEEPDQESTWSCGRWDLGGPKDGGKRYIRLREFIRELRPLSFIAWEEVLFHRGRDMAWHVVVQMFGEDYLVPYAGIAVSTIKKYATGSGRADKEEMVATARIRWPHLAITDDNVADSLWVTASAIRRFGLERRSDASQKPYEGIGRQLSLPGAGKGS